MKLKISAIVLAILILIISTTGCAATSDSSNTNPITASSATTNDTAAHVASTTGVQSMSFTGKITENLKEEDLDSSWDASTATQITLTGESATVSGSGAAVSGGTVTINAAGTYVVSGTLSKGQILISTAKNDIVRLVLNGADITADKNAAIYAEAADKLVLILADGTVNSITDTASYTYADTEKEEPNAAIFSKCNLSVNGTGSLLVNGNFNHGIATKDDMAIASGNITVNAVGTSLRGKDSITILDGTFDLTSKEGDGIKSTNDTDADKGWVLIKGGEFNIKAYNDGIQAYTTLQVDDGTFDITAGGGWPGGSLQRGSHSMSNDGVVTGTNPADGSYKGLKGVGSIVINGGTFIISSYDDSVHSNGDVIVNGGNLTAQSGDDGIHADGTVTLNGGVIDIKNSYEAIEGAFINLSGGKINLYSTDDGTNVNNSSGLLTISGGDIYINDGGDGIDSNGGVVMTGGTVYVDGPTASQDGAIDYQRTFEISGGTLVAVSLVDNQAPSASEQPSIALYYTSTQKAGTKISVKSADGATIVSHTPQKDYASAVISTPDMKLGSSYAIYSNGTKLCDVTLSSSVTSIDDTGAAATGRMGGGMGGRGGMGGNKPEGFDPNNMPEGFTPRQRPGGTNGNQG